MTDPYDEFSDLLGAYALDAVDADEREQIELHLATCPRCRAEVAEHREVASFLSHAGAPAPDGVWDRIAEELAPPAPPMRMAILPSGEAVAPETGAAPGERPAPAADATAGGGSTPAGPSATTGTAVQADASDNVTPIGQAPGHRGRSWSSRTMLAVVAVAASIIVLLGVVAVGQTQRVNRGESVSELAADAAKDSKLKVDLEGEAGTARAVVGSDGMGYLIADDLPAPADGDVYQLWGKVDGTILSLGTFGDTRVVPFSVDPARIGDIELFAVTQEHAPGVVASTNPALLAGTV